MDRISTTNDGVLGGNRDMGANPMAGMPRGRFGERWVSVAARVHERPVPLPEPSPKSSHRAIWERFVRWCEGRHVEHWPASPETVADYMKVCAEKRCRSTVCNIREAISSTHRAAGFENRFAKGVVEATFRELVSSKGWEHSRRCSVTGSSLAAAEIKAIRAATLEPRRQGPGLESERTAKQRGRVERALCSLVLEAGIRCEQTAALEWRDLSLDKNRKPTVTIRTGSAEPHVVVTLPKRALRDLHRIAPGSPVADERIFPFGARQIANHIRAAARAAGLESRIAGEGPPRDAQAATKGISPSTAHARSGYWRAFGAWCDVRGAQKLPAQPQTVAQYLREVSETSSNDTIQGNWYAIKDAHREFGHEDPCATPLVEATLQDIRHPSSDFTPTSLDPDALAAIRATAMKRRENRFHRESAANARKRGLVDIALCSVLHASRLSVGRVVALKWREVEILGPSRARLTVRPEDDPRGSDEFREIAGEAVGDLEAIRGNALPEDKVFGLSCRAVYKRVKAAGSAAGIGVPSAVGSSQTATAGPSYTATAGPSRTFTENPPHTSQ